MFKLEKTKIKESHRSGVSTGRRATSSTCFVKNINEGDSRDVSELSEIKVGDMVLVSGTYFIKTSPITKIVSSLDNELIFETGTSEYKLEKDND